MSKKNETAEQSRIARLELSESYWKKRCEDVEQNQIKSLRDALTKSLNEVVVLQGQVKEAQAERDNALAKLKAAQESLTVSEELSKRRAVHIQFMRGVIEAPESAIRNLSAKE